MTPDMMLDCPSSTPRETTIKFTHLTTSLLFLDNQSQRKCTTSFSTGIGSQF